MKAFILAAGEGTRMFPFSSVIPKALLPIGGIPVVRRAVDKLLDTGVFKPKDIIICVLERDLPLFAHELRDVRVQFAPTREPIGTAGHVYRFRQLAEKECFMTIYPDDLCDINYKEFISRFLAKMQVVAIAVTSQIRLDIGLVEHNESIVESFDEKPYVNGDGWTGLALFDSKIMRQFKDCFDIAGDLFPKLLRAEIPIHVYIEDKEWMDIGNIASYRRALEHYGEK